MSDVYEKIMKASASKLFEGENPAALYRKLARQVHPDMVGESDKAGAEAAFQRLTQLWDEFSGKASSSTSSSTFAIKTHKHEYVVASTARWSDGITSTHIASMEDGYRALIVAGGGRDKDLVDSFASALKEIPKSAFLPEVIESFTYASGEALPCLALRIPDGEYYSFTELENILPTGLAPEDIAWIFRRQLYALGTLQDAGYVHGAPGPDAWLVEPFQHGLVLSSWACSVKIGDILKAVPPQLKSEYPLSVLRGTNVKEGLDIRLAAHAILRICPPFMPKMISSYLKGCSQMGNTPTSAWTALAEFDEILEKVWGKRRFHKMEMPESSRIKE